MHPEGTVIRTHKQMNRKSNSTNSNLQRIQREFKTKQTVISLFAAYCNKYFSQCSPEIKEMICSFVDRIKDDNDDEIFRLIFEVISSNSVKSNVNIDTKRMHTMVDIARHLKVKYSDILYARIIQDDFPKPTVIKKNRRYWNNEDFEKVINWYKETQQ